MDREAQVVEDAMRLQAQEAEREALAVEEAVRMQAQVAEQARRACACYTKKHCVAQITCVMVNRCVPVSGEMVCEPKQQCGQTGKIACSGKAPTDCHPERGRESK